MVSVFAAFSTYDEARDVYEELSAADVSEAALNLIVQDTVADSYLADVEKMEGLDSLVHGRQGVATPDVGTVYAVGEAAIVVTDSASRKRGKDLGLEGALSDFSLGSETVSEYVSKVSSGGVLIWAKVDDDQSGRVGQVFRKYNGASVAAAAG